MQNHRSIESMYSAFIDQVEEYAIFSMDSQGIVTSWNAGAERIKGYKEEEVIGKHFRMLFPENYQKEGKPEKELEEARQKGIYKNEDWRRKKDGSLFWAKVALTKIVDEEGKSIGFTKVTGDRTRHRQYEEDRKQYQLILQSLPHMIFSATPEGEINWVNEWFSHYTGMQLEDGKLGWNWVNLTHPDDVAPILQAWTYALSTGNTYRVEQRVRKADGQYSTQLVVAKPIRNSHGKIVQWVGSSVDIELQKQLEASHLANQLLEEKVKERAMEIVAKNEELLRTNQTLDNIVHIAAHDLRAPITNLNTLLDLLLKDGDGGKKQQLLPLISSSVERLSRTVNGLIEIIQAQHSGKRIAQVIDLHEIVDRLMQEYSEMLQASKGSIHPDFTSLPAIRHNEAYLESILRNLISNALKYRHKDRSPELHLTSQKVGEFALLTVKDNGIGMDLMRVKDKLFLPFNRFSQQAEGSGVGLHLVKNMVERNGGYITVESQPDQGSTFRIFLREYE
ncbi:PAS domain S-box protein [Rhodocytophaga aerolata]|uniref:histidine kinase n=1 Tax=Rhodocytophaga aerolata TaxID=455078 RepID=A0ABT8R639_9BACT|nr:PAS domain S-box protein [Rhodocytophaga aerolata]MDO1446738.1 PAS domain S-box protein [Rhodocytophaga aerolata]